jgi:hypothetical protein
MVTGYVLKQGPADVEAVVTKAIADGIAVLPVLAERGLGIAMNRLHTRPNDDDNSGSSKNGD